MGSSGEKRRLDEAATELSSKLESRNRAVREADATSAYAIRLGASNPPFDCDIFSPDYRYRLPESDPVRIRAEQAEELREYGSPASSGSMRAAHEACLAVLGVSQSRQSRV